jgi:hypothetical protein
LDYTLDQQHRDPRLYEQLIGHTFQVQSQALGNLSYPGVCVAPGVLANENRLLLPELRHVIRAVDPRIDRDDLDERVLPRK